MEGELAGEVVHAAGVHEAQRVADRLGAQHALARDRTEAAVGERGGHDAGALAGHLDGAELQRAAGSGSSSSSHRAQPEPETHLEVEVQDGGHVGSFRETLRRRTGSESDQNNNTPYRPATLTFFSFR